ncbi:MAG: hypothetical protein HC923_05130 [Myxococcales bacterium]|nr:hypothetical protein [Myxococcales bacterium]
MSRTILLTGAVFAFLPSCDDGDVESPRIVAISIGGTRAVEGTLSAPSGTSFDLTVEVAPAFVLDFDPRFGSSKPQTPKGPRDGHLLKESSGVEIPFDTVELLCRVSSA